MITTLNISGICCGQCVHHITKALQGISGVRAVQVDVVSNSAAVEHEDAPVEQMVKAVREAGYQAALKT